MTEAVVVVPDEYGRPVKPSAAPTIRVMFGPELHDRQSFIDIDDGPMAVVDALKAAESGDMSAQNDLFEQMEEKDGSLAGIMSVRRLAPTGLQWVVEPLNQSTDALEAARLCRSALDNLDDFNDNLGDMQDAVGKSISVMEIFWERGDSWLPTKLRHVNAKRYKWDTQEDRLLIAKEGTLTFDPGLAPTAYKTIIHRSKMRSGHPVRGGVYRTLVLAFLFRNFAAKDWSTYNEIFGMPLRVGMYPTGTPQEERDALATAVRAIGTDAAAIISEQTKMEFVQATGRDGQPFEALYKEMRREYALSVLGQEYTNVSGPSGARAASQVAQMVRQDLLETDCKQLGSSVRRELFRPIVGWNMGWDKAKDVCPKLHLRYEPPSDLATLIEVDQVLFLPPEMRGLGLPIKKGQVYARYNVEPPEDVDVNEMLFTEADIARLKPQQVRDLNSQEGQNNDRRDPAERRVDRTRAGSNAAALSRAKALGEREQVDVDELREAVRELVTMLTE